MSDLTVTVQRREEKGKGASRRLRREGLVPAVVYGAGKDSVAITVDRKTLQDFLKVPGSENSVFLLKLGDSGKSRHAMIRDLQFDVITRIIEHVDFQRVLMDEKVRVTIPVTLTGTPTGVKDDGGVMDFVTREIEIECLPGDIPAEVTLDVSELTIGMHIEASALELPEGVENLMDEARTVVSVSHSRVAESLEAEEEEEEGLIEAIQTEPEVISRGKDEEEESDG